MGAGRTVRGLGAALEALERLRAALGIRPALELAVSYSDLLPRGFFSQS